MEGLSVRRGVEIERILCRCLYVSISWVGPNRRKVYVGQSRMPTVEGKAESPRPRSALPSSSALDSPELQRPSELPFSFFLFFFLRLLCCITFFIRVPLAGRSRSDQRARALLYYRLIPLLEKSRARGTLRASQNENFASDVRRTALPSLTAATLDL